MESSVILIEPLFDRIEAYSETSIKLAKLKILDSLISIGTILITRLSVALMFILFTIMAGIAVAQLLGEMMGKPYYGFFIVAACYLILGVVLHFFLGNWIKKPINDLIISASLN